MSYCVYYQAKVNKTKTWFFVATLRSFENLCFDRTYNVQEGIFELLVPECQEADFLKIMQYYIDNNIVINLQKLSNRFKTAF